LADVTLAAANETAAYSTGVDYWGHSQIVDPHGNVVSVAGQEERLVIHTGDLGAEVLSEAQPTARAASQDGAAPDHALPRVH